MAAENLGERFSLELLGEPFPEIPWDSSAKNPVDAFAGLYTHKNWASHLKVIQQFGELQGCILMDGWNLST